MLQKFAPSQRRFFFLYGQESRTALEGVPSIQQISNKQLEYVLKVCSHSFIVMQSVCVDGFRVRNKTITVYVDGFFNAEHKSIGSYLIDK
jgi:hypothetical protein